MVCDRCAAATSSPAGVVVGIGVVVVVGVAVAVDVAVVIGVAVGVATGVGIGAGMGVAISVGVGVGRTGIWSAPKVGGVESQAASASTRDTAATSSGRGPEDACIRVHFT